MDLSTVSGLIAATALIAFAILLGGGWFGFVNGPSLLIALGGGMAATLTCFPLPRFMGILGVVRNAFFTSVQSPVDTIAQLVEFSRLARRDGILALEEKAELVPDGFLRNGLQLTVDGMEPELIRSILRTDLAYVAERHRTGAAIFGKLGEYCPAFGMIGTLVGLVQMLQNMDDPSRLGPGMATALLTTLYGAIIANVFALPVKHKLEARSQEEVLIKSMMLEGILSIQSGDNPRVVEQKLSSFLSNSIREPEPYQLQ